MNSEFNPKINLPYPKINIKNKDINLAYKIFDLYAGEISEFSAASQYSFQSIYLSEYNELSKILEEISIVEMHHVELLGNLIKKLGLIPYYITYKNNIPIPWNSDYINFTTNYREMLTNNIKREHKAIDNYNKIIKMTSNESIISLIRRIILDEEKHIEILSKLLNQYDSEQ